MKYLLGLLLLLLSARVSAQKIQDAGTSAPFVPPAGIPHVSLSAPNVDSLLADDDFREKNGDFYRIGVATNVNLTPENSGSWTQLPNGLHQWCLTISSPEAKGLSFVFDRFVLGPGSTFSVYDVNGMPVYDQLTSANNQEHATQHIELCAGSELTLVLTGRSRKESSVKLSKVFHIYRGLHGEEKEYGDAGSCEVNVNCSPAGDSWQDEKRGIARVLIVLDNEQGYCSGSLINNLASDCKPYFLTAQHCGVGASASDFNQWRFFFGYESPDCGNFNPGTPSAKRIEGCVLIANSLGVTSQSITSSDFLLLQLGTLATENAVITKLKSSAINAYWNGWDAHNIAATGGAGIHHPEGDIKKISTFSGTLASTNYSSGGLNTHWRVQWTANANGYGVTEGGSSGSPIFSLNGGNSRIVGTLSGGGTDCSAQTLYDLYGKLSYDWTSNGTAAERQLKPFLDPANTGLLSMDGSADPCRIHANFIATPTTQAPGGTVALTDLSTGNPTTWNWTITPSTGWSWSSGSAYSQNPEILFTTQGQYTVKLEVSNGYQSDSLTRVSYITITLANNPCVGTSISCDEFISDVSLNTLDQSSGCDNYTSYSNGTTLIAGSYYSLSIMPQIGDTPGVAYDGDEIAAWIDYNGDYDFEDEYEQIAFLSISGTFNSTFPFTVPASAIPGVHTMRVRISYNSGASPIDPCGTTEYGEVEDYPIIIAAPLGLNSLSPGEVVLYPNPAASEVIFSAGDYPGLLTITDTRGAIVSRQQIKGEQKCDLSAFTPGVYYFEFVSDGLTVVKKLVKL